MQSACKKVKFPVFKHPTSNEYRRVVLQLRSFLTSALGCGN